MHEIHISGQVIRLGQLLKLAGAIDNGADAKDLLAENLVRVNGELETRRGRQLRDADVVSVNGRSVRIAASGTTAS